MKGIEGSTLGRYELRQRIAQGGMSEVYLGYDRRVRRKVAIKVLYGSDEPFVRRFEREALAVGILAHDHILPLYDFGEQRPWYYLVMPYIEGCTLRDYLHKRERLTLEEAGSFLEQIALALQYAHDHDVVHRDVKPSNILLRPDGYAYLVDFGLAKAKLEAESLTHAGAMVGTPEYMAPEQSNGVNDYRSDIYSLGIILYQMLTGHLPFTAESPVAISLKHIQTPPPSPRVFNSELPSSIEEVILKALAKDPNERYQEARALADAYKQALQHVEMQRAVLSSSTHTIQEEHQQEEYGTSIATEVLSQPVQESPILAAGPLLFPLVEAPISVHMTIGTHWRKKRLRPALIALLCLLLLVPISLIGLNWQRHDVVKKASPTRMVPTHASQQWLTMTAIADAHVQATLAAQARVQATAGITGALGAGKVLYANGLTSSGGGWINDGFQCFFSTQGYHVYAAQAHSVAWCYSKQTAFSNAVITAQAQLLHGDIYGLMFRLDPTSKSFYVLELNNMGGYRFVRAQGDKNPLNWLTLIDWTYSSAIQSGYKHINTFLIIATGPYFRFYINQQLIVTTFSDIAYASGSIGFLVGGDSSGGTEAIFSNVLVFQK